MSIEQTLRDRSGNICELCGADDNLSVMEVLPSDGSADEAIFVCSTCRGQIEDESTIVASHWRCLNDSMWSESTPVQVMAYRMLHKVVEDGWSQDLIDMMFLEDDVKAWAQEGITSQVEDSVVCKDSNGTILNSGDAVTVIKDLVVKGAGFTAKQGTVVKNISLTNNPEQIEGRVNGTKIVLLSCFLKKS